MHARTHTPWNRALVALMRMYGQWQRNLKLPIGGLALHFLYTACRVRLLCLFSALCSVGPGVGFHSPATLHISVLWLFCGVDENDEYFGFVSHSCGMVCI